MKEPYMIYTEKYGKVQSGNKLDTNDYGEMEAAGFEYYNEQGKLAVSLAAHDGKLNIPLRSKIEFEKEIKRLLGISWGEMTTLQS